MKETTHGVHRCTYIRTTVFGNIIGGLSCCNLHRNCFSPTNMKFHCPYWRTVSGPLNIIRTCQWLLLGKLFIILSQQWTYWWSCTVRYNNTAGMMMGKFWGCFKNEYHRGTLESRDYMLGILENYYFWRFHGSGVMQGFEIVAFIFFCTKMHYEYLPRSWMCFCVSHFCSKIPKICY